MIGSGNLATSLGVKLTEIGHKILQVYSKTIANARILAELVDSRYTDSIEDIDRSAAIYLIAIKDDRIDTLSAELINQLDSTKIIAHTSGVNSPNILPEYFENRSLFYPLQSFSKHKILDWNQIPIFIEGNEKSIKILTDLALGLSQNIILMNDQIRTHLHLASVFSNNFTTYNLIIAEKILNKSGVPFEVIHSLMNETIDKAFTLGPINSQTGPAKRGDQLSIEKHIRLLVAEFPEYRTLYKKYSQIIEQEFKNANPGSNSTS